MNKIQVLAPSVAERIAAGEVIERPSSVVKELVENSLDAGSTQILVRLEEGGKSLIEVTDNGHGMSPEDLALCIQRHATSKLSQLEDLEKISTLGFRGEALPSISAVSDLSILSRSKALSQTFELHVGDWVSGNHRTSQLEAVTFGQFIDRHHGTRIRARGLFSQVPARLKFLKSQASEVSHIRDWIERLAISYPHVGFQVYSNEKQILNLYPESTLERIRTLLADGEDYPIVSLSNEQDGFRDNGLQIQVHWLQGYSSPQNRKLIQVVNRRAIRDRMLQQALLAPFRQVLLPGQFPALVLEVQVHPAAIDVNVHPTKTEVRFLDNRKIFQSIDSLVQALLRKEGAPAHPRTLTLGWGQNSSHSPFSPSTPTSTFSNAASITSPITGAAHEIISNLHSYSAQKIWINEDENRPILKVAEETFEQRSFIPPVQAPLTLPQVEKFVGIFFNTYLAFEKENELTLIDQHAAHERIRYESLRKRIFEASTQIPSQSLLIPEVIRFPVEKRSVLQNQLGSMEKMGFELEIFGDDSILFRGVPIEWGTRNIKIRLKSLIDRLLILDASTFASAEKSPILDEALFEALASEACHSSVRSGDVLSMAEAQVLREQLFQCKHPWNCPHGRPTVVKITENKIEEWFKRKI